MQVCAIMLSVLSIAVLSLVAAERIIAQDFGDAWPFTVQEGVLSCRGAGEAVFMPGGISYAMNGPAKGRKRYADVKAIWAPPSPVPGWPKEMFDGPRKNIGPIIDAGLKLCQ